MILLYQVGKWVAANFKKPHQLRLMRLFLLAAEPPIFYAAYAAKRHYVPGTYVPY